LMKGDNNNFVDEYHPAPTDVVGKLWLHVPKVGRLINSPRKREMSAGVVAAALAGMVAVPAARKRQRRPKGSDRGRTSGSHTKGFLPPFRRPGGGGAMMGVLGLPGQVAASIISVVALAAVVLGAFSFTRPTTAVVTEHLSYRQSGTWTYSAATKGDVYPNGVATTGQPIFLKVAPVVKVAFAYNFASALPVSLTGRARLMAVLTSSNGWSHTLPVGRNTSFSGTSVHLVGKLDLPRIEEYLASIAAQIGQTGAGASYTLALEPAVHVSGLLAGSFLLRQDFNPSLSFTLEYNEAQLSNGSGSSGTALAPVVQPSAAGFVSVPRTTSAHMSLLGLHPSVAVSREVAAWALAASVLAFLGLAVLLRKASRAAETNRIDARYGPILVGVERPEGLGGAGTVRVVNIEDLVKIAENQGRMILYSARESGQDYFVHDQSLTYIYSVHYQPSRRRSARAGATRAVAREDGSATEAVPGATPDITTNGAVEQTSHKDQV